MKKNLPEIIKANPGCCALIDNDCWWLYSKPRDEQTDDEIDNETCLLASDGDTFEPRLGDGGYGSGNCYGGDLLQALALIVGVKVESV